MNNIPEDPEEDIHQRVAHMLVIEKDAVIHAFRPGPTDSEKLRPIIATLIDKKAQYWHKHGLGHKIRVDVISGDVWINPDLTKEERAENYLARQERKKKREALAAAEKEAPATELPGSVKN